MSSVPVVERLHPDAKPIVEDLRQRLARCGFGVTVQGAQITVRWNLRGHLREVSMVIVDVDDGLPVPPDPDLDK